MSLFRDDFYSTKVSKWSRGASPGFRSWQRTGTFPSLLIAGAGGALLMLVLFWALSVSGAIQLHGGGTQPEAAPSPVPAKGTTAADNRDRAVDAAAKVGPAVVSVVSTFQDKDKVKGMGIGSGVIFQKTGDKARIVTNNHVVEGGTSYEVILSNGDRRKASLVGSDRMTDLAVLETDAGGIKTVADFGDSDSLKAGQSVIAIGNPLGLELSQSVTAGIISWPKRTIPVSLASDGEADWEMEVIQTDAAINQGNSGGALVNLDGQVIGINSLKYADTGVEGLGFAIPSNQAKPILDTLVRDKKVKRPYIGITPADLQSFTSGLEVLKLPESVKAGVIVLDTTGPAKEAGLKMNDVIIELDGKPISGTIALRKYLYYDKKIGDKIAVTYYRAGKKASVNLTLGELTDK
ncbi:S1C family serine protease [Paenibacillus cymbidii]|uniref:S1C family serine protease n=1 Tax=Paenibacillus cymbidii TaxID=1639034 RepID=UPI0010811BED|nr:trypsin-like peptidase domain-containing protein [Paenibacillus cymbidii]